MNTQDIIRMAVDEALVGHTLVYTAGRCECGIALDARHQSVPRMEAEHRAHLAGLIAHRLLATLPPARRRFRDGKPPAFDCGHRDRERGHAMGRSAMTEVTRFSGGSPESTSADHRNCP